MRAPVLPLEFHVARAVRDRARFDEALFAASGHAVLARPEAAHRFAAALDASRPAAPRSSPAELFALGLLDEAMHVVIAHWRTALEPLAFRDALAHLRTTLGEEHVQALLLGFIERFPPVAVHRGALAAADWLAGASDGRPHVEIALEELLLLSLEDGNPAATDYRELFDASALATVTAYGAALREVAALFAARAGLGPERLPLLEFLRAPLRAAPHSLIAQLEYIRHAWRPWIGDLVERLQLAFDLRQEEARWHTAREAAARGEHTHAADAAPPDWSLLEGETERFSPDAEWMPRSVMIAKSTLVWLDQLSRRHGRPITRLDQVPDSELDRLAEFGINVLWLIGVWERSHASRRIKQLTGNPDAAASAYAVHDYVIAGELGGDEAWRGLRDRAMARGIRLASDMVPNHMGIDSRWVLEHPEWFLARRDCPYPSYTFDGPELSEDPGVSLRIEDHYWDRSDAAVVFRRVDHGTGDVRFIYHGNDGTSFPWNDTAQLDYLNPDAREAVIQAILAIARRFPIIRFDAAMTLARRHIQRLWFPEPGSGGAIPSRAGHGFTRAQFDRILPREFWREVVDRVAAEAPGTLLLAEAFWLMEGYFVRTLGMHRVYNSAFMVMLRDERNADFRRVLRDTLEFDPGILQRWVNFMNNPDERTAVDQFGRGEKYFGVCTLLATLPGLPMFGHGQIEGFEERYGMEFRRALSDEAVDEGLEREHWRRIAPLLRMRGRFAGAERFLLYDCRDHSGHVNEDVFAWSNRDGSGAALVLYHNRWADAHGHIRWSAAFAARGAGGAQSLVQRTLLHGLGLDHAAGDALLRCRDLVSGHEYLLRAWMLREHGLRVDLGPFGSRVLLDWQVVVRDSRPWDALADRMPAHGFADLEGALWDLALEPVHHALTTALTATAGDPLGEALTSLAGRAGDLLSWPAPMLPAARARLAARIERWRRAEAAEAPAAPASPAVVAESAALAAWLLIEGSGAAFEPRAASDRGLRLFDELRLRAPLAAAFRACGVHEEAGWRLAARVRALLAHAEAGHDDDAWRSFLADDDARHAARLGPGDEPRQRPDWLSWPARLAPPAAAGR